MARSMTAIFLVLWLCACATTGESTPEQLSARDQLNQGMDAWSKGEVVRAERAYREAIRLDPANAEGYIGLGAVLAQTGRDDEAITTFEAAIERAPKSARAYSGLAVAKTGKGDLPGAIQAFEKAVEIDPQNVSARFGLGLSYVAVGERAKALDQARAIEPIDPALAAQLKAQLSPF